MMKLLINLLAVLLWVSPTLAYHPGLIGVIGRQAAGGGGCSSTATYTQATVDDYWSYIQYGQGGGLYTGTTAYTICAVDFYVFGIIGNISAKTYRVSIYARSGSDLGSELGYAIVNGSSLSTSNWGHAAFSPAISTGSSGFAVVIAPVQAPDSSNYFSFGANASSGSAYWDSRHWLSGTSTATQPGDFAVKIYE